MVATGPRPTLAARAYTDPALAAWERTHLFPRSWQLVARASELPGPGSYLTTACGEAPVLLTRDLHDELRALSNVCRHRAGPVATGSGVRSRFVCGYHGWSYDTRGALAHAPKLDLNDLPAECHQLPTYALARWHDWLFVRTQSEAHAPSFEAWLGEIAHETRPYGFERLVFERRMTYHIACDWKVYIENFLEAYHLPLVHPALTAMTDVAGYRIDCRDWHVRQLGPPKPSDSEIPLGSAGSDNTAAWYWLFPNCILNCSFGVVSTNVVLPEGPGRCLLHADFFAEPAMDPVTTEAAIQFSHQVQLEDIGICEAVQRGLASGAYEAGVLHPQEESALAHFHALLAGAGMLV